MGKCEKCGKEIDDKYKFCLSCVEEMKKNNNETGAVKGNNSDLISELSKINSNLYALRTIQEYILLKEFKAELKTDPETKRLTIKRAKK